MTIKAIVLGGPNVGKTSIIKSYMEGYVDEMHRPTVAAAYHQKSVETSGGKRFELAIWDTAGAEQYRSIAPMYFRSAHVALIVADATRLASDDDALYWARTLKEQGDKNVPVIVVMNKTDLVPQEGIAAVERRADAIASKYGDRFALTSALNNLGIRDLFATAVDAAVDALGTLAPEGRRPQPMPARAPGKRRKRC
jgi:Ras-related protein Rab-5C